MNQNSEHNFKSGYVAIVGQPNVGKSTLLNNLLNFKVSAVTRKPQTTRHQIRGILTGDDHQIVFLDTPGLLEPKYRLQEAMLQAVHRSLKDADMALFMVEASSEPDKHDVHHLEKVQKLSRQIILVVNKIDRISKARLLPLLDFYHKSMGVSKLVPISALKIDGLDALKQEIIAALPPGLPFYSKDQVTDHPERFLVSEIIREKIFLRYADEIPYSTTVGIDEFKEREHHKDFIRATIYIEKKSQKGILIGKKGAALRKIGQMAREEIEETLGRPVYLELWVKVKEKWRQSETLLKEFGYFN
ncbi:GTPase Era [candidate division KSB1 bacterium]|nr:GTPase Era [candidate division KSB1 bacterium]